MFKITSVMHATTKCNVNFAFSSRTTEVLTAFGRLVKEPLIGWMSATFDRRSRRSAGLWGRDWIMWGSALFSWGASAVPSTEQQEISIQIHFSPKRPDVRNNVFIVHSQIILTTFLVQPDPDYNYRQTYRTHILPICRSLFLNESGAAPPDK